MSHIQRHLGRTHAGNKPINYIKNRLFLVSDLPRRLPTQFLLSDDGMTQITSLMETNDPIILSAYAKWKNSTEKNKSTFRMIFGEQAWWVSIRPLKIKGRNLYSGFILSEADMMSEFIKGRRIYVFTSAISFVVVLIATFFLWLRSSGSLS